MREATDEESIQTCLALIKIRLKERGSDPNSYGPKYLREMAEKMWREHKEKNPKDKVQVLEDKYE